MNNKYIMYSQTSVHYWYRYTYSQVPNKQVYLLNYCNVYCLAPKAELLQEGIFFLIHLLARDVSVMKKLEIEKN